MKQLISIILRSIQYKQKLMMKPPFSFIDKKQSLLSDINSYSQQLQTEQYQIQQLQAHNGQQEYFVAKYLNCLGRIVICLRFSMPCICCCIKSPFYHQNSNQFGVLQNFGRFVKVLPPGFNIVNPITQKVTQISRQTKILNIRQPIITKDNITAEVWTVIFYRIVDPVKLLFLIGNKEIKEFVREISFGAVRTICGEKIFQTLLEKRLQFSSQLSFLTNLQLKSWGVYIQQVLIKDILLDQQLKNNLQMLVKTKKKQQASLINAKAAVSTANFYLETSQVLNSKAAYQMRYLNLLNQVSQIPGQQKVIMVNMKNRD